MQSVCAESAEVEQRVIKKDRWSGLSAPGAVFLVPGMLAHNNLVVNHPFPPSSRNGGARGGSMVPFRGWAENQGGFDPQPAEPELCFLSCDRTFFCTLFCSPKSQPGSLPRKTLPFYLSPQATSLLSQSLPINEKY